MNSLNTTFSKVARFALVPPIVLRFDIVAAGLALLFVGGLYLDGWAHFHGRVDDSFFTPWHAVLYGSYLLMTAFVLLTAVHNRRDGQGWRNTLPAGYRLVALGAAIFAAGGVADMFWHELFGVEADVEALISPSHLLLAVGMGLMITGPLRAGWRRPGQEIGWFAALPVVLSAAAFLSLLTFFTSYAHPMLHPAAVPSGMAGHRVDTEVAQSFGAAAIMLQTALLMGLALLLLRRWRLPFGSLALLFTLNGIAMSVLHDEYRLILPMLIGGLTGDASLRVCEFVSLRRSPLATHLLADWPTRLLAFVTPVALYLAYFAVLSISEGLWWSVHMWLGTVFLAGMTGLFVSYLVVPPEGNNRQRERLHPVSAQMSTPGNEDQQ